VGADRPDQRRGDDNTGAVLPGATVKAVEVATGLSRDTVPVTGDPRLIQFGLKLLF
jgi:hypothetical protein